NGCKTFFRRALVNKQTFTCQFNGECQVGKNVRCVCRSCRLKKCFEAGMDPKAIQHDRDKIRYTKVLKRQKEEARAQAEAEREKLQKVKEEMGSPRSLECCDQPSSSTSFGIDFDVLGGEITSELDCTLGELMRIEKKIVDVRNSFRSDDQISTLWNIYIGSRALLDDADWLASASLLDPILDALSDRPLKQANSYQCVRITPWAMREWIQRDFTLMMEWVKMLPGGFNISVDDKVTLQREFALTYAVFQMAFYTRDTTVLAAADNISSADQINLEERMRGLKRPREEKLASPPPPAPSFGATVIPSGFMNLANALYKQPLAKRIKDEILEDDEPTCSAYLRTLTQQAAAFSASSPSVSTPFALPSTSSSSYSNRLDLSTLPSFLIKNGLAGVKSIAEKINDYVTSFDPLPTTMNTGLPGALSCKLAFSLHSSVTSSILPSSLPSFSTPMPVYPKDFFSILAAASPGSLTFPQSPLLTASSPLIAASPLLASSPLMMPSMNSLLPSFPSVPLPPSNPFLSQLQMMNHKEKTPEESIDVETVSVDGRSEGKGTHSFGDIVARTNHVPVSTDTVQGSATVATTPAPTSSSIREQAKFALENLSSMDFHPTEVKEEPFSPVNLVGSMRPAEGENGQITVIRSTADAMEKDDDIMEILVGEDEKGRKGREEDEDTPCDPTPEAMIMNRLNYPDGGYIEKDGDKDRPFRDELYGLLIDGVWKQFRKLDIDQETFVLYKMMVFFNEELTHRGDHKLSEEGVKYVHSMRQKLYMLLMLHLQKTRGRDGHKVFANLLLLGSTVSRVRNALRKTFALAEVFVPSNDLVDQLILRDKDERARSPSAFRPYHPTY
ncbi:hypothetical protein PFISCL1PPCAC_27120, partial [Pristionchus fissidentatus]